MRRFLIVDDEEDVREMLCLMCRGQARVADVEACPLKAMSRLAEYDVLVTDLRFGPGQLTGLDLAKAHKLARPDGHVIMATGMQGVTSPYIDTFFLKPVPFAAFARAINAACKAVA